MLTVYQRSRLLFTVALVVCFALMWYVGALLSIPFMRGYGDSLLLHPSPVLAVGGTFLGFGVAVVLGTLLLGRLRPDGGLFAACLGLSALSMRGGTMRSLLQMHPYPGIYLVLAVEVLLLWLAILGASYLIRGMMRVGLVRPAAEQMLDDTALQREARPLVFAVASVICQIVLTALFVALLAKTSSEAQVLVAVFVGAGAATAFSGAFFDRPRLAAWTCAGPVVVAVLGYALAWSDPQLISIGLTNEPLARPAPLDYASAGCAGALLGAWLGAKYQIHWLEHLVATLSGRPVPERASSV